MKKIICCIFIIISILIISKCYCANSDFIVEYLKYNNVYQEVLNVNLTAPQGYTLDDVLTYVDNNTCIFCTLDTSSPIINIYCGNYFSEGRLSKTLYKNSNTYFTIDLRSLNNNNVNRYKIIGATSTSTSLGITLTGSTNVSFVYGDYTGVGQPKKLFQSRTIFDLSYVGGRIVQGYLDDTVDNDFLIAEMQIGQNYVGYDLTYKLYSYDAFHSGDESSYNFNQTLTAIYVDSGPYNYYNLYGVKNIITESNDYIVRVYSGDTLLGNSNGGYIVVLEDSGGGGTIVIPSGDSGTITDASGDNAGNVDLTGVQNRLDGVNQNLGVINQNIEDLPNEIGSVFYNSGDASGDNKGIVQKVYDELFGVPEEFIENTITQLGEILAISGDEVENTYKAILEVYDENQKNDFIISWDPFYFEEVLMIPSGDINFSKLERDNESIQNIMHWVRIILSFSVITLLIRQIWILIMKSFGIATEIYDDLDEEAERFDVHETSVYNIDDFGQYTHHITRTRRIK